MAALRDALARAGLQNVRTYLQSGNVVFDTRRRASVTTARAAEAAIARATGLDVPVILRSATELDRIVRCNPFVADGADPRFCHVTFLRARVKGDAPKAIDASRYAPDMFVIEGREVYLYLPNGYARTKLQNALFERVLQTTATTRNWSTVTKLNDMVR
jgi:uncharacterized protein (DUF1697 family)